MKTNDMLKLKAQLMKEVLVIWNVFYCITKTKYV